MGVEWRGAISRVVGNKVISPFDIYIRIQERIEVQATLFLVGGRTALRYINIFLRQLREIRTGFIHNRYRVKVTLTIVSRPNKCHAIRKCVWDRFLIVCNTISLSSDN